MGIGFQGPKGEPGFPGPPGLPGRPGNGFLSKTYNETVIGPPGMKGGQGRKVCEKFLPVEDDLSFMFAQCCVWRYIFRYIYVYYIYIYIYYIYIFIYVYICVLYICVLYIYIINQSDPKAHPFVTMVTLLFIGNGITGTK